MNELKDLLSLHRPFHSNRQIDDFILGRNAATEFGLLKQALRELHSRYHSLLGMLLDRADSELELAEFEDRTDPLTDKEKVALARLRLRIESNETNFTDTLREFARFFAHARELRERLGELTAEKWDELDRKEWTEQIRRLVCAEILTYGKPTQATLQTIVALEPEDRVDLLSACGFSPQACLILLKNAKVIVPSLPAAVALDDVRDMLERDVASLRLVSKELPSARGPRELRPVPPVRARPTLMGMSSVREEEDALTT